MRHAITGHVLCLAAIFVAAPALAQPNDKRPLALAVAAADKWGYIDRTGNLVIPLKFDMADDFHDGLARISAGGKMAFIDAAGRIAVGPKYDVVREFSEGLAAVNLGEQRIANLGFISKTGKWGYIDNTGKQVIALAFTKADSFAEGLAAVNDGNRSGLINHAGTFVFERPFEVSWGFHEGLALVKSNFKMLYLDRAGKTLQTPKLDDNYAGHDFSEGLAAVSINDKWGYIDKTGKLVIAAQFIEAEDFSEGLAAVEQPIDQSTEKPCVLTGDPPSRYTVAKKYGYIDKTGKMVIPPLFESAGPFVEGVANVSNCQRASFIDKSGKTPSPRISPMRGRLRTDWPPLRRAITRKDLWITRARSSGHLGTDGCSTARYGDEASSCPPDINTIQQPCENAPNRNPARDRTYDADCVRNIAFRYGVIFGAKRATRISTIIKSDQSGRTHCARGHCSVRFHTFSSAGRQGTSWNPSPSSIMAKGPDACKRSRAPGGFSKLNVLLHDPTPDVARETFSHAVLHRRRPGSDQGCIGGGRSCESKIAYGLQYESTALG